MIENARVQRSELGEMSQLGGGGEGTVYALTSSPSIAYKEYTTKSDGWSPNEAGYNALRRALNDMPTDDRELILARTAWPETAVMDGSRFVGILMRRIPETFLCSVTVSNRVKTKVRELNFLIYPEHVHKPGVKYDFCAPSRATLLSCALAFAQTAEVLHRNHIVMGDISGSNAAWKESDPGIIILDCDGFSTTTNRPICIEKETPEWIDPLPHSGTNLYTDSYKIGLILYRMMTGTQTTAPTDDDLARLESMYPEAPRLASTIDKSLRAVNPRYRPTASEWVAAIEGKPYEKTLRGSQPPSTPTGSRDFPSEGDIWLDGDRWETLRGGRRRNLLQIPRLTLPLIPVIAFGRACLRPDPNDPLDGGDSGDSGDSGVASIVVINPKPSPSSPQTAEPPKRKFRPLT